MKPFLDGRVSLWGGDCLDVVRGLADNSIDSVVTDPPYALVSISKRFGKEGSAPAKSGGATGVYQRASSGFMGKNWDTGETAFAIEFWAEILRVLKPGGHVAAFGGTRSYHRLACAIEDAGFEIRDQLAWAYGVGFPKSHNVSRNLDNERCRCEETERNLRSVLDADVPSTINASQECRQTLLASVSEQGLPTAGRTESSDYARSDESSMEGRSDVSESTRQLREREIRSLSAGVGDDVEDRRLRDGTSLGDGEVGLAFADSNGVRSPQGSSAIEQSEIQLGTLAGQSQPQKRGAWDNCERCGKPIIPDGLGSALKPAWEPICLARKPLSEATVAANVLRWGTGAINVDGCRVEATDKTPAPVGQYGGSSIGANGHSGVRNGSQDALGRFPANLCHDSSDEVLELFPDSKGQQGDLNSLRARPSKTCFGDMSAPLPHTARNDSGSAARFFYSAKASKADRALSKHPTVKPVKLMQWICRLITPAGGVVLDPFAGTGTTGEAAWREGFSAVLIEREEEYIQDIERRMLFAKARPKADQPTVRKPRKKDCDPGTLELPFPEALPLASPVASYATPAQAAE